MRKIDEGLLKEAVRQALKEDVGPGDITTNGVVPPGATARGEFITCESCVVAGLPVVEAVFRELDASVGFSANVAEGSTCEAGDVIAEVSGPARAILTGERVALNFIQRLSGIATLTSEYVRRAGDTGVKIKDTRKTTPGLRFLEKYAVEAGGGVNHRMGLYDAVMLKDNHLALLEGADLREVVAGLRSSHPGVQIEIETEDMAGIERALAAGADVIMLDNMSTADMKKAVARISKQAIVEASGCMSLERIEEVAATGVDWISVGALTYSARAIDIKLEFK